MKPWIIYAIISMAFAGATSVIAKFGMSGVSSELSVAVRTCFVFVFVMGFAALTVPGSQLAMLKGGNCFWLGLSAATTSVSWIFYYKAIKEGDVSTVALIDKGSVVVAVALAFLLLRETITLRTVVGCLLIISGLLVIAKR